jgi:hypothetical protein
VALPWDEIAKEVEPFLSAEGIKQHLGKLRLARVKAGRRVPDRPEKGTRRKSRATQIKQEEKEEAEMGTPSKLAGLLYHGPETQPKKVRTPRKSASATTPGDSTVKAGRKRVKSTLDREALLGTPSTATPTKVTTGKRGRKAKAEVIEEEEEDYAETPTKKAKTGAPNYNFRAITKDITYNQDAAVSDNDEEEEEEEEDNLLPPEDDGDGDYKEEGDAADDDKMEDVKSQRGKPFLRCVDRSTVNKTQHQPLRGARMSTCAHHQHSKSILPSKRRAMPIGSRSRLQQSSRPTSSLRQFSQIHSMPTPVPHLIITDMIM